MDKNELDLKITAMEQTDKQIYKMFINSKNDNKKKQFNFRDMDTKSPYDLYQTMTPLDNPFISTSTIVELKNRIDYTYEQFDTIYLEQYKIRNILQKQEEDNAQQTILAILYPLSDKIVLIDITNIDWEQVNNNQHPYVIKGTQKAAYNTTKDKNYKILKDVIYFPLKKQPNNNITYIYNFPQLDKTYKILYKENWDKLCHKVTTVV